MTNSHGTMPWQLRSQRQRRGVWLRRRCQWACISTALDARLLSCGHAATTATTYRLVLQAGALSATRTFATHAYTSMSLAKVATPALTDVVSSVGMVVTALIVPTAVLATPATTAVKTAGAGSVPLKTAPVLLLRLRLQLFKPDPELLQLL